MKKSIKKFDNSFQEKMEEQLIKFKIEKQYLPSSKKNDWVYENIIDNIYPPQKYEILQYFSENNIQLHKHIKHVRSSQMFAFNILYYLLTQEQSALIQIINQKSKQTLTEITDFKFEYSLENNLLGEWKNKKLSSNDHLTSVDTIILAKDKNKKRFAFVIEVKFTEPSFSACSGEKSEYNKKDSRLACENSVLLLDDFNNCYLQGAKGKSNLKRKYFDYFNQESFRHDKFNNICPFAKNYQSLRNHALSKALIQEKIVDEAFFVTLYHEGNKSIEKDFKIYADVLAPHEAKNIFAVTSQEIVNSSKNSTYKNYYANKYSIQ